MSTKQYYRNDLWTLDDDFQTGHAALRVARLALQAPAPFAVRVTGKWGLGKTSILRMAFATLGGNPIARAMPMGAERKEAQTQDWDHLKKNMRQKDRGWDADLTAQADLTLCVWFSPWQHQNAANPLVAMLMEVREQFSAWVRLAEGAKTFNRRGGLAAMSLLERTVDAAATFFAKKNIQVARGMTKDVREAWRSADLNIEPDDGQRFHLLFEEAVDHALESVKEVNGKEYKGKLVIFIDDLDRCEESVVVSLLEAVKLYLATNNCIFVMGLDDHAVLGALQRHWPERGRTDNREYLEKLFQATVAVPQPRIAQVKGFLIGQLTQHRIPNAVILAGHIVDLLEPNPRKIKNFVNSLCANWMPWTNTPLDDAGYADYALRYTLTWYLRLFHPPVWRLVERQPAVLLLLRNIMWEPKAEVAGLENTALLREFLERAFSHVLDNPVTDGMLFRKMTLDQAVELFHQRLDQRRSDDTFRKLSKTKFMNPHLDEIADIVAGIAKAPAAHEEPQI